MSGIPIAETTTIYGTEIKRYLDTNGNYPQVRRKYIPSDGSKFSKVGIESITKRKIPGHDATFAVIKDGKKDSYTLQELKDLFKDLNLKNIKGHIRKQLFGPTMQQTIKQMKRLK